MLSVISDWAKLKPKWEEFSQECGMEGWMGNEINEMMEEMNYLISK
jgi:hypothetical protein